METWKDIDGAKSYAISNFGRIKRLEHKVWCELNNSFSTYSETLLKPNNKNRKGYNRIKVYYLDGTQKMCSIHRLVAEAFIENPLNLPQVNHKDGKKLNNVWTNLEWVTQSQNIRHSIDILGEIKGKTGESCNFNKLKEETVKTLPELLKKYTKRKIARLWGVAPTTITEITSGRSWKHLNLKFNSDQDIVQSSEKFETIQFNDLRIVK
jgi:hypothetical protein